MRLLLAFAAAAVLVGSASAQPGATPKTRTVVSKTTTASASSTSNLRKPRTPQSIECSKQADAKGLHKTDRKKFMSSCKKAAK